MNAVIKPRPLQPNDTVRVIGPASFPNKQNALKAESIFKQMGLKVTFGTSLTRQHGYLAGTDQQRTEELHEAFADPQIKAVFSVCGGYGSPRIADKIDYELIRHHPKIFWGYSDITFLLNAIFHKTGLVTFHGPMLSSDLGKDDVHPLTINTFTQLFSPMSLWYTPAIYPLKTIVPGRASGRIVGGNLSLVVSSLGTDYEIDTTNRLLLLEEINEEPYRVDRMLNQLRLAGKFEDAAGIVFGDFNQCVPVRQPMSLTLDDIIAYHVAPANKPSIRGFRIGHCSPNLAVPIGLEAFLDTEKQVLRMHQSGVRVLTECRG